MSIRPFRPFRPRGNSSEAHFWQWVYDSIIEIDSQGCGPGMSVDRTTRGRILRMAQPIPPLTEKKWTEDFVLVHPVIFAGDDSADQRVPTEVRNGTWAGFTVGEQVLNPFYHAIGRNTPAAEFVYENHPGGAVNELMQNSYARTRIYSSEKVRTIRLQFSVSVPLVKRVGVGIMELKGLHVRMGVLSAPKSARQNVSVTNQSIHIDGVLRHFQFSTGWVDYSTPEIIGSCSGSDFDLRTFSLIKQRGAGSLKGFLPTRIIELSEPAAGRVFFSNSDEDTPRTISYANWAPAEYQYDSPSFPTIVFFRYDSASLIDIELSTEAADGNDFFLEIGYGAHPNPNIFGENQPSTITFKTLIKQ